MIEEEFIKQQRKLCAPIVARLDQVPLGKRIPSDWKAPEGYALEKTEVESIPVERLIPTVKNTDTVILQAHGGGYVWGYLDQYRECAVRYSKMAGDAEVISFDYRIAPKETYPAALEDTVKVYKWLLEQGYNPEKIVIVGDSAGGNLVLVTTLYLKDHQIPLPKGVIAISPWSKIGIESDSITRNFEKDSLLGKYGFKIVSQAANPDYFVGSDWTEPYVSPVYGDYKGFPNLLIQLGSYEVLLDDALDVAQKAKAAGVNVRQTTYEGMSHDFQLFLPELEESKAAWEEMSQFVKQIMS